LTGNPPPGLGQHDELREKKTACGIERASAGNHNRENENIHLQTVIRTPNNAAFEMEDQDERKRNT
jgi:hypothetical protein